MSLQQIINYNNSTDFAFDSNRIEVLADARLKFIDNPGLIFTQQFTNDSGFTYNPANTEFVGGVVRQKKKGIFLATFDTPGDPDADWSDGDGAGSLQNGATVSAGKLNCTGALARHAKYADQANIMGNLSSKGFFIVRVTPNSATPAGGWFFDNGSNNLYIHYDGTSIRITIKDDGGSSYGFILSSSYYGSWTSGVTKEIAFGWDLTGTTKYQYAFIDGVLKWTKNDNFTRNTPFVGGSGDFIVGNNAALSSGFDIDSLFITDECLYTNDYTPGESYSTCQYCADSIDLPAFIYSGIGSIQSIDNVMQTFSGTPRWITGGYWCDQNDFQWKVSNGTYAQANTPAEFAANVINFPVAGAGSVVMTLVFDGSAIQGSFDLFSIELTGQIYPTNNPNILVNSGSVMDLLQNFSATLTATGLDAIKFNFLAGTEYEWFNTISSAWETTDGTTYEESNTVAEILANMSTLNLDDGPEVKLNAFLHSDDGSTTPILIQAILDYSFAFPPTVPNKCNVYGTVLNSSGIPVQGATVTCIVEAPFYYSEVLVSKKVTAITKPNGTWDMPIVENDTYGGSYKFITKYNDNITRKKIDNGIIVPNQTKAKLSDLIN